MGKRQRTAALQDAIATAFALANRLAATGLSAQECFGCSIHSNAPEFILNPYPRWALFQIACDTI
jgi:hypothetical protein